MISLSFVFFSIINFIINYFNREFEFSLLNQRLISSLFINNINIINLTTTTKKKENIYIKNKKT